MSLLDDLVSYWKLDEASGNAIDAHGSNDLTESGSVGSNAGIINNARTFSGSFLSIADNADLSTGNIDFSFSGWYYPTADPASINRSVFSKWTTTGNQREYSLFHLVSTKELTFAVSSNGSASGSVTGTTFGAIPLNNWVHFICWHDAANDELGIWLNGTEQTASYSAGGFNSTSKFNIGTFGSAAGSAITGRIDEVGFWKKVLTSQERSDLYNSGAGLSYDSFGLAQQSRRRRIARGGYGL